MKTKTISEANSSGEHSGEREISLPVDAAYHYIGDMLVELCQIAEQAKLKDLAALLRLSVAAVEANRRTR